MTIWFLAEDAVPTLYGRYSGGPVVVLAMFADWEMARRVLPKVRLIYAD